MVALFGAVVVISSIAGIGVLGGGIPFCNAVFHGL